VLLSSAISIYRWCSCELLVIHNLQYWISFTDSNSLNLRVTSDLVGGVAWPLDRLERRVVTKEWIDHYREEHKSRAQEVRLKGGLIKPRHPHWNLPFCNLCDRDFEVEEDFYMLYVGGHPVGYHVECVLENLDTSKLRNIMNQDRSYRERHGLGAHGGEEVEGVREQFLSYIIRLVSPGS
jgi:hypothetical protein